MKHKLIKLSLLALTLTSLGACKSGGTSMGRAEEEICYVDFFNNYKREDFTLSNGFTGKGNNLLYLSVEVSKGSLVAKPEDPSRKNYDFVGWYTTEECVMPWNFEENKVDHDVRLFAKWEVASGSEIIEPPYTPPSTVLPASESVNYKIDSVMYFKVSDTNQVKVSTAALTKLEANKANILPLMEYQVKEGLNFSATYENKKITIKCEDEEKVINVVDNSPALIVDNATYEQKAKNYEAKALLEDSYHVMLAGSSSIEFWEDSSEVLEPIVSFNHGIGGTTIEQWKDQLNQRLVYPYKPKMVVYYVGINNVINSKQTKEVVWTHLEAFFNKTHEDLPDTKVQYILMNQLPSYGSYKDVINYVNNHAIEYQKDNPWLTLINPGLALLKENGEPDASYFRSDGLHLSYYGYIIWGGIIKESIIKGLNE